MPYAIQNNDEFRLTLWCRWSDQESQNDLRILVRTGVLFLATDQDLLGLLSTTWGPLMTSGFATDASYSGATLRRVIGAGAQPITKFSILGSAAGTSTTPTLPRQVTGLISLYTDVAGKKNRGRFYYPFPATEWLSADGSPAPVFVGATLGDIATEVTNETTVVIGAQPVKYQYGLHNPAGDWLKYETSRQHDRWATQRKRGDFGQQNRNPFGG